MMTMCATTTDNEHRIVPGNDVGDGISDRGNFGSRRPTNCLATVGPFWYELTDWTTCREQMLNIARRVMPNTEDAEDAVHDAIVAAIVTRAQFQSRSQPTTWLHRIVINMCSMQRRAQLRRPTATLFSLDDIDDRLRAHDRRSNTDQDIAYPAGEPQQLLPLIHQCIDQLPDRLAQVIILRDVQRCDTQTTARRLCISQTAVKTRLHRARVLLRALVRTELRTRVNPTQKLCNLSRPSTSNDRA